MSDVVVQADSDDVDSSRSKLPKERHPIAKLGDFPFPILDGGRESRQVVWIRNHANYMAAGGVLDYVRAVSVVIRGLLVNTLVGLPYLLLMGLGVAALNVSGWRFGALIMFLTVALIWVATAPVATRLWNAARLSRIDALGTTSSVAIRDRFERGFGALLVAIAVAATIEGMSFLLDDFHRWTSESSGAVSALSSFGTFVLIVGAGAGPLLPKLGKVAKPIVLLLVGVVGLLLPFLIVMFVADFLVFTGVSDVWLERILWAGLAVVAFMIVGFVVILLADRRSTRSVVAAVLMLISGVGLYALLLISADLAWGEEDERSGFTDLVAVDLAGREELVEAMASSPPSEVIALAELIDFYRVLESDDRLSLAPAAGAGGTPFGQTSPEGARLELALSALGRDAAQVPGVEQLIAEINAEFSSGRLDVQFDGPLVADEVEKLRRRGLVLGQLLAEGQSTRGLLTALMDISLERPQDLIAFGDTLIAQGEESITNGLQAEGEQMIADGEEWRLLGQRFDSETPDGILAHDLYYTELFYSLEETFYEDAFLTWFLPDQFPVLSALFAEAGDVMTALSDIEFQLVVSREQVVREAVFSSRASTIGDQSIVSGVRWESLRSAAIATVILAALAWLYSWLAIDPNRTSLSGMYRDRLAAAFLVGADTKGDIDVEVDLDLRELSRHDAGSIAPYHLLNSVVNLQGSKEISTQDRSGDFFVFSKRFVGSKLTGYCRSETMEHVFPEMSLSTAMAVSGAAASPNMGRATKPALVAFMTMLNIRMGLWVPNPGRLEDKIGLEPKPASVKARSHERKTRGWRKRKAQPGGFTIEEVIAKESYEVRNRWALLENEAERIDKNELVGLAFSGGGIRSATLNMGITQALHKAGVFECVDYMSSVSGGGYLGSSISSAMRSRYPTRSDRSGVASLLTLPDGKQLLTISPADGDKRDADESSGTESFVYEPHARLDKRVEVNKGKVKSGQRLLMLTDPEVLACETKPKSERRNRRSVSFGDLFGWRVRPTALLREIGGSLNEDSRAVNVSDGGHIENLATIELLRRRCKYIVVGDGEMDAKHHFRGLMVLLRTARVEEGIDIQINLDALRLGSGSHAHDERDHQTSDGVPWRTARNWVIGKIVYPETDECGYLLYLKSSLTGLEDEAILGYRAEFPDFPHQSTADQFFDEGQFESYRTLGYHIASQALRENDAMKRNFDENTKASYAEVQQWFEDLWQRFGIDANQAESSEG